MYFCKIFFSGSRILSQRTCTCYILIDKARVPCKQLSIYPFQAIVRLLLQSCAYFLLVIFAYLISETVLS